MITKFALPKQKKFLTKCGSSSFGRARPCQGRGGRFEPGLPLSITPFGRKAERDFFSPYRGALVVELVDTQDLKSCSPQRECGFKSRLGHSLSRSEKIGFFVTVRYGHSQPVFTFQEVATRTVRLGIQADARTIARTIAAQAGTL